MGPFVGVSSGRKPARILLLVETLRFRYDTIEVEVVTIGDDRSVELMVRAYEPPLKRKDE